MNEQTITKIREHYEHARNKHPYFCDTVDGFLERATPQQRAAHLRCVQNLLALSRECLDIKIKKGKVWAWNVLDCELEEIKLALAEGDSPAAIEEVYDAIAVLLRVVDVLEGRQKLGKPEGGAE